MVECCVTHVRICMCAYMYVYYIFFFGNPHRAKAARCPALARVLSGAQAPPTQTAAMPACFSWPGSPSFPILRATMSLCFMSLKLLRLPGLAAGRSMQLSTKTLQSAFNAFPSNCNRTAQRTSSGTGMWLREAHHPTLHDTLRCLV